MVDLEKLNEKIEESGMTIQKLADRAGMNRMTLDRRLKGYGEFKASEIAGVSKALKLKPSERNDIFLR